MRAIVLDMNGLEEQRKDRTRDRNDKNWVCSTLYNLRVLLEEASLQFLQRNLFLKRL